MSQTTMVTLTANGPHRASKTHDVIFVRRTRSMTPSVWLINGAQWVQADQMPERNAIRKRVGLGRDRTLEGRRTLDLAQGILIGFRRYQAEAAFEELVAVAHKHDVSVSAVAAALVALATGTTEDGDLPRVALAVADLAWGGQFAELTERALGGGGVGEAAV